MTTKATGAELKRFYEDSAFWRAGIWHEDEEIHVSGEPYNGDIQDIPDNAQVSVAYGCVMSDGEENPPWTGEDGPSFETYFRRWRKVQTTAFGSFECPKDKLEAVKAAIKAAGGKAP